MGGVGNLRLRPLFVPSTAALQAAQVALDQSIYRPLALIYLSLSPLADDEVPALYRGDAISTSPSASLRPKSNISKSLLHTRHSFSSETRNTLSQANCAAVSETKE